MVTMRSMADFIFQDFPHFLGTVVILYVLFEGLESVIKAIRGSK